MDSDGSGSVSKDEFLSARPSDVTETMASNLFDKLDSTGSGSLSESDIDGMEKGHGKKKSSQSGALDDSTMQALLQAISSGSTTSSTSSTSGTGESQGLDDMIASMDVDGNGTVTKEEFVNARPSDVSEDMASNLWSQFDTESAGSLSTSDLKTAMAENGPPPPPPGGHGHGMASNDSSSDSSDPIQTLIDQLSSSGTTSSSDTTSSSSSSSSSLLAFLDALKSYDASVGYESTKNTLSSILALA